LISTYQNNLKKSKNINLKRKNKKKLNFFKSIFKTQYQILVTTFSCIILKNYLLKRKKMLNNMFNLEFICFRGINIIFKKFTVDLLILSLIIACFFCCFHVDRWCFIWVFPLVVYAITCFFLIDNQTIKGHNWIGHTIP
jgi:hypothetical protein